MSTVEYLQRKESLFAYDPVQQTVKLSEMSVKASKTVLCLTLKSSLQG